MRWLVTLLLLILVAAGGAWLLYGDRVRPRPAGDAASAALPVLDRLRPEDVRKIELTPPNQPAVSLTRAADGTWTQPGNWPVRESEAAALANALTGLRTRFHPIKLEGDAADPAKYGLADNQHPAVAVVRACRILPVLRWAVVL